MLTQMHLATSRDPGFAGVNPRICDLSALTSLLLFVMLAAACGEPRKHSAPLPKSSEKPPVPLPTPAILPIPQLPKLPDWTLTYTLPKDLVITNYREELGLIYDRLHEALARARIANSHSSVYAIGFDGFAIVTHCEYIDDHGIPLDPRWSVRPVQKFPKTFGEFWRALVTASPGRYRVMVIVVTSHELQSLKAGSQVATPEDLSSLERGGEDRLPDVMRRVAGTPDRRCVAIIYEFYRESSSDEPKSVNHSNIDGPDHLASAGLWPRGRLS